MVQGVQTQNSVELLCPKRQGLSSAGHERRVVAEHEAAVGGQPLSPPTHHFDRQVDGDCPDSDSAEKLRGPAGARGEIEDEVVGAWRQEMARDRELEQVVPALARGRPVKRETQTGRQVLFFVGQSFGIVAGAINGRDPLVFPRR